MDARRWLLTLPALLALVGSSVAYVPAQAVVDTTALNLTDGSSLDMIWSNGRALPGVYGARVSYQLEADVPTGGIDKGAFIYFSESTMGANMSTTTPWIAFISCDQNETDASQDWDIFTLARDRGAVAALMYSNTAESCLLNPEYITPEFDKVLDIFATTSQSSARIIDSKLQNATTDEFKTYNGTKLNSSFVDVTNSLIGTPPSNRSYIAATLTARNSTGQIDTPAPTIGSGTASSSSGNKNQSTAMIVLYAITGLVSAMFLIVITLGAVRALRHPERYGARRERDPHGNTGPQSTAGGVAQAILDTFPVIKFSRHRERPQIAYPTYEDTVSSRSPTKRASTDEEHGVPQLSHNRTVSEGSSIALHLIRPETASVQSERDTQVLETPDGDEACPICLLDFETGEDLRVLPCEKAHAYHKACIDPWLLQVASSCPLCRKDFNPTTPAEDAGDAPADSPPLSSTQPPTASGFARYLAFMRRERPARRSPRQRRREADQTGPGPF